MGPAARGSKCRVSITLSFLGDLATLADSLYYVLYFLFFLFAMLGFRLLLWPPGHGSTEAV